MTLTLEETYLACAKAARENMRRYALNYRNNIAWGRKSAARRCVKEAIAARDRAKACATLAAVQPVALAA